MTLATLASILCLMKIQGWQLKQRQALPLEAKVNFTKDRIRQWYEYWGGEIYVAFSGGKDSTVGLDLVRSMYPDVPAVFCDTGLEYPEIRDFVKTIDNVTWLKPRKTFKQVIEDYGYPVVSKVVSRFVWDLRRPLESNPNTQNLRRTGLNRKGIHCPTQKLPKKWYYLINAPFKISNKCCDVLKKDPFFRYNKESGRKAIIFTMTGESSLRKMNYLKQGCNSFDIKYPSSAPMSIWNETDIWDYIKTRELEYSSIYDKGELRTGCIFCCFGVDQEEEGNTRFDRLARLHPKLHRYCMDTLGLREVLNFVKNTN